MRCVDAGYPLSDFNGAIGGIVDPPDSGVSVVLIRSESGDGVKLIRGRPIAQGEDHPDRATIVI